MNIIVGVFFFILGIMCIRYSFAFYDKRSGKNESMLEEASTDMFLGLGGTKFQIFFSIGLILVALSVLAFEPWRFFM